MTTELYKKHRPKTFKAMLGADNTVAALQNMVKRNTLPHVILFHGPSGCGKTTLARILRDKLECHEIDWKELNCSDVRGVDSVRKIAQTMTLAATGGPVRIYLLDEVHQWTKDAQHAALKMLEDTPKHVYFFLCTTDPQKLLKTIRTRCCEMPVRNLTYDELEALVKRIIKKEKAKVLDEDVLHEIVSCADGSARVALVLLDKIINLSEEQQLEAVKIKAAEQNESIDLCRALIKSESWRKITNIIKELKAEPETVRYGVIFYAYACLIGGENKQAYRIICAFEDNFFDSKKAGLIRACYEVTHEI